MSRLDELISQYCPNGVPFKKVKNVYTRVKGTPITAGKMKEIACDNGEIRIFAGGKTIIDAHEKDIPKANITRVPAVLVQSRGVIDVVYYDKPFTFKNEMWAYTSEDIVSVKFLYYVLKNSIQTFRDAASGMGSLPQISLKVTEEFMLPVPPLEVQCEIVHILDNFTELTAELTAKLTAELTARKKQYEFYRNSLLDKDDSIEMMELGELCDISSGGDVPKGNWSKEKTEKYNVPIYSNGVDDNGLYGYTDTPKITKNAVTIAGRGAGCGNSFIRREPYYPVIRLLSLVPNEKINVDYLYHCIQRIEFKIPQGGIPQLTVSMVAKYKIPVPKKEVQEQIVSTLNNFETICTDLSIGLPAEIEARKKQYEYYRDKLLSFQVKSMINVICDDIKKAVESGAYISALSLALTLPDLCGKAEYPNDGTTSRYKKWYRENVGQYETFEGKEGAYMSADVVYSLRNHLLHQGSLNYDNKDIRQEQNKVDKFLLYFNTDECDGGCSFTSYRGGTNDIQSRSFEVNALNLIMKLRLCAMGYYKENKEKFDFMDIKIINR